MKSTTTTPKITNQSPSNLIIPKKSPQCWLITITSFANAKPELKDDPAEVAAEPGLVGTIDCHDGRVAGALPLLDYHDVFVVAGNAHGSGIFTKMPLGIGWLSEESDKAENRAFRERERKRCVPPPPCGVPRPPLTSFYGGALLMIIFHVGFFSGSHEPLGRTLFITNFIFPTMNF